METVILALLNRASNDRVAGYDRIWAVGCQDTPSERIANVTVTDDSTGIEKRNRIIP